MRLLKSALLPGVLGLACGCALAQLTPVPLQVGVQPPADTLMLTQTVNAVTLTVTNFTAFTNLAVSLLVQAPAVNLLDDGNAPDAAAGDGVFAGNLVVPAFAAATNFTARFTTVGQDLSVTNDLGELLPEAWTTNVTRVTYRAVVRPSNDNFAGAFKIPPAGGVYPGNNGLATIEPAEPFHGDDPDVAASVWWTWSPTNNTRVLVDTAGSAFAPVLAVYTGGTLANLKLVAASTNDVAHGLKANVQFDAKSGVTYRIAVAGFDAKGQGDIRLSVVPGGEADTVPPLVNIMYPPGESIFTTNLITVRGTAKDPVPDATGVTRVLVQLNDEPPVVANGTTSWSVALTLPAGTNVISAQAEDLAGNLSRPAVVVVRYQEALNDNFAEALPLTDLAGTVFAATGLATREAGEPAHAGNEGGHSVWYWFQAPASGTLRLSTAGSTFDTLLAVYAGDSLTNLTLVGANDDATPGSGYSELTVSLTRDRIYHIAVDGFGEASGVVKLQHTFTTVETLYNLTLGAALGGAFTPPSGLYPEGSTQVVTALPARDFKFLGWQGSVNSGQNPLTLVMTQNYTLSGTFQVISYTDGFESGGFAGTLPWTSFGTAQWMVQSDVAYAGQFAARSGIISDQQQSSLFLRTMLMAGTGAFRVRVSSEPGWDGLEFYLNGNLLKRWTGEVGWENYQFGVIDGVNTLEWRYVKDANFSVGMDAAFLDNLYLPLPDQAVAAQLSVALVAPQGCQIAVQGYPGRSYVLQAGADLKTWVPVYTNGTPSGSWVWSDPAGPSLARRFYRALLQ